MLTARRLQTATLLRNGKVLVVGGFGEHGALSNAELYDPVAKSWAAAASLTPRRWGHTATLLNNGKVLVVGGTTNDKVSLADAQLYNPDTGTWKSVVPLDRPQQPYGDIAFRRQSAGGGRTQRACGQRRNIRPGKRRME